MKAREVKSGDTLDIQGAKYYVTSVAWELDENDDKRTGRILIRIIGGPIFAIDSEMEVPR